MALPSTFKVRVVGLSFVPSFPDNVLSLRELACDEFGSTEGMQPIPVFLIRNPANEFDSNAIEVHCPQLGLEPMLGHVPAGLAARLAPSLDAGEIWNAHISMVAVHPDHPTNPGIELEVFRDHEDDAF